MSQRAANIKRGMLLAEVLLAATLLVVVALLLLGLMPTAGRAMSKSRKHAHATSLCRQELQKAHNVAFSDLTDELRSAESQETLQGHSILTTFQVQRRVIVVSEQLKRVEATVSWPEQGLAYVRMATMVRGEP